MKLILFHCMCLTAFFLPLSSMAQNNKNTAENDTLQVDMYVHLNRAWYHGDSIPNVTLHEFYMDSPMIFPSPQDKANYNRMVKNIKYVFPIAQLARRILLETHDYLETLPNEKAKKRHIAMVEKGVKEQYAPLVKKLSRSQGKLLVKLIDRECGQTSFEMVKAFLGPLKASFYQVFAGLFGNSLTKRYEPQGADKFTERIVRKVESGQI